MTHMCARRRAIMFWEILVVTQHEGCRKTQDGVLDSISTLRPKHHLLSAPNTECAGSGTGDACRSIPKLANPTASSAMAYVHICMSRGSPVFAYLHGTNAERKLKRSHQPYRAQDTPERAYLCLYAHATIQVCICLLVLAYEHVAMRRLMYVVSYRAAVCTSLSTTRDKDGI